MHAVLEPVPIGLQELHHMQGDFDIRVLDIGLHEFLENELA